MRLALVTGGSRGLGAALCERLVSDGWHVIEFSRTAPHPYSVKTDLTSPEVLFGQVVFAFGELPSESIEELLVVSNAGTIAPIGPSSSNDVIGILGNLDTNFASAILFISLIVDRFQIVPCRKTILNISSGAAQKPYSGWSLYCASKAGVEMFVRTLALEQQRETYPFIAINVNPGVMDTQMQSLIRSSSPEDFPDLPRFQGMKDNGLLSSPEAVAAALVRISAAVDLVPGSNVHVKDWMP